MIYKTIALNLHKNCETTFITGDFENKLEFIKWFEYKGYKCDELFIKETELFNYIWHQTPHSPDDFKTINEVPEDYKGFHKAIKIYKRFKLELMNYNRKLNSEESLDEKAHILSELNVVLKTIRWYDIDIKLKYYHMNEFFNIEVESAKYNDYYLNIGGTSNGL